jgi:hypothetical protein
MQNHYPFRSQPKSLVKLAGKKVASSLVGSSCLVAQLDSILPDLLVQEVSCHLKGEHLVDFLQSKKGLVSLYGSSRDTGRFQILLSQVLLEWLNLDNGKETRHILEDFIEELTHEVGLDNKHVFVTAWDMGLGVLFSQNVNSFQMDFYRKLNQLRYTFFSPIEIDVRPDLFPGIWNLISRKQTTFKNGKQSSRDDFFLFPSSHKLEKHFFALLRWMVSQCGQGRFHHALALGLRLVCERQFLTHSVFRWYFLHVFGMMAVAMSQFHTSLRTVFCCLDKMKLHARNASCQWHMKLYAQKIYSALGLIKQEADMFLQIRSELSRMNAIFESSLVVHVETRLAAGDLALWDVPIPRNLLVLTKEEFQARIKDVSTLYYKIRHEGTKIYARA